MKSFNKWLKTLNESVTFKVSGIDDSQQQQDLHYLCWDLVGKLNSMFPKEFEVATKDFSSGRVWYATDLVVPDGDYYGEGKEEINFYSGLFPKDSREKILKALLYLLPEFRMSQNGMIRKEVSRMANVEVYRIPVSVKSTEDPAPEFNIGSGNAKELLTLLDVKDEGWGNISVADLSIKLNRLTDFEKQMALRADDKSNPRNISFGLKKNQLETYLQTLEKMVAWALKHNYDTISYG